jgi:hypothetical protein
MSPCNNTAAQDCKRDCLAEKLDVYLDAVMHHDLTAAPLASGFRQTENAVVKKPGDGMWRSATALGKVQRRFFDPVTAQAAYFGLVEEGDTAAIVAVRLQVQHDQITEAEWYIGRRGDPGINGPANAEGQGATLYDVDNLIANPPPERTVPPGKRLPREALIAITNSYFDGITSHDGTIILAHPGCVRVENGFLTTQRPIPADWNDQGVNGVTDCTSGMGNFQIALVAGRRYPLVDEAAQVVLGTAVFLRDPGSERRRNSFSEFFFIDEGRIRHIYAAMFYPAPGRPVPNWPPYDGNFPLPAALMQEVQ